MGLRGFFCLPMVAGALCCSCTRDLVVAVSVVQSDGLGDLTRDSGPGDVDQDNGPGDPAPVQTYRKLVTINHSQVSAGPLLDFPVLIALSNDADLKTTAGNGHVSDTQGRDMFFVSDTGTLLDFETEQYDSASGSLFAWVRLPSLSSSQDTLLWLRYGDPCPCTSKANPAGVWGVDDMAVYHLDHDFNDSTAHARNGLGSGAPGFAAGTVAHGASFDGTSQYVDTLYNDFLPLWTVSCWVLGAQDPGNANDAGPVMREQNYNVGWHHGGDTFRGTTFFATDPVVWWSASFGTLTHGTWYHLVGTYDGTNLVAYKNGSMVTTTVVGLPAINETASAKIGRHSTMASWFFAGQIDEVRISSTARSAGFIQTSYNNQATPSTFYTVGLEEIAP